VRRWHRHHKPVRAHYFAAGAYDGDRLAGVIIVGQPVAPALCNGLACEVVRLACDGETPHAASLLLGAAWRAARALGFRRAVSYTRVDESGTCYHAAGWRRVARVKGRDWDNDAKPGRWLSLDGATPVRARHRDRRPVALGDWPGRKSGGREGDVTAYLTTDQVAERLGVHVCTIRAHMAETARAGLEPAWVMVGRQARWQADEIHDWLRRLDKWRRSRSAGAPTSSAGTASTGPETRGPARRSKRRSTSAARSTTSGPSGGTGRLVSLARSLASKMQPTPT